MTTTRQSATEPIVQTTTRWLVALDIDGTLLQPDGKIPSGTVEALDLVRAAGHEVVLASGRSLVGLLPVATRLGLLEGFAVCSNGTLIVRLDPSAPAGYVIEDARRFDPGPVIHRALNMVPGVRVGVEDVGRGWYVNHLFDPGQLNGSQKLAQVADLVAKPATRLALHAPGVQLYLEELRATGVTVTPAGAGWLDITAPGTSKAVALETIRVRVGVPLEHTIAVGDGANDLDMLAWAGHGVAMGHSSSVLRQVADAVTGTIQEHGAVTVLYSLLPAEVDFVSLSRLAAQLATAVRTAQGSTMVRVWHGHWAELSLCEVWALREGNWVRHARVPAGTGATMRGIESAAKEAGLTYPRGDEGRRRAHWRASFSDDGPAGFELPLALT